MHLENVLRVPLVVILLAVAGVAGCIHLPGNGLGEPPEFVRFEAAGHGWDEEGNMWIDVTIRNTSHWTWAVDGPLMSLAWDILSYSRASREGSQLVESEGRTVLIQPYEWTTASEFYYGPRTQERLGLPGWSSDQGPYQIAPNDTFSFRILHAPVDAEVEFMRYQVAAKIWARPLGETRPTWQGGRDYHSGCFLPLGMDEWFRDETPPPGAPPCTVPAPEDDFLSTRAQLRNP